MTLIVSDNSPLNLLIRLKLVEILPQLFSSVAIPPEVALEMNHPKAPQAVRDFIASPPPWLIIRAPSSPLPLPNLDPGEAAAITLALELNATLLIDEQEGRQVALDHGLRIVGAVGILERAANAGMIADLAHVHDTIRSLRFHVSNTLLSESLARHLAFKQK